MSKDAVATMGDVLPDDAGGRDAVHVAVFSAYSDWTLRPGQAIHIGGTPLRELGEQESRDTKVTPGVNFQGNPPVAIVDPFLVDVVKAGQRFWAYLYPRTITALSHRWSQPSLRGGGLRLRPAVDQTGERAVAAAVRRAQQLPFLRRGARQGRYFC